MLLPPLIDNLKKMGLPSQILGNLAAGFVLFIGIGALSQLKRLAPLTQYVYAPGPVYFMCLITIALSISIILKISQNEKEPAIIFADKIIFRKVEFGPRTQKLAYRFALSPKIGIKNKIQIYDTKMALCYMRCRQAEAGGEKHIERYGVEEFTTTANYVETVHRFSFFSEELSYGVLKPISEALGAPNHDRIVLVLTGFYGKRPKRFMRKHELSFSNIKFADQTPKVVQYQITNNQLTKNINWDAFHSVNYLSEIETSQRIEELKLLLAEMYVEPESKTKEIAINKRFEVADQRLDEISRRMDEID